MRVSTIAVTAVVLTLLALILYPVVADAGERRWITNQDGRTVGYLEPDPYGPGDLIRRDRDGRTVGMIERHELDSAQVMTDRRGERLGRVDGRSQGRS
jgi:hypothetical protein